MPNAAQRFMASRKPAPAAPKARGPGEQRALDTLRREAAAAGATLASDGEGGLPSSTVLGAMRKAEYTCQICGRQEDLSVHHKAKLEHPSKRMARMLGRLAGDDPNGLACVCTACHNRLHNRDRKGVFEGKDGEPAPAVEVSPDDER